MSKSTFTTDGENSEQSAISQANLDTPSQDNDPDTRLSRAALALSCSLEGAIRAMEVDLVKCLEWMEQWSWTKRKPHHDHDRESHNADLDHDALSSFLDAEWVAEAEAQNEASESDGHDEEGESTDEDAAPGDSEDDERDEYNEGDNNSDHGDSESEDDEDVHPLEHLLQAGPQRTESGQRHNEEPSLLLTHNAHCTVLSRISQENIGWQFELLQKSLSIFNAYSESLRCRARKDSASTSRNVKNDLEFPLELIMASSALNKIFHVVQRKLVLTLLAVHLEESKNQSRADEYPLSGMVLDLEEGDAPQALCALNDAALHLRNVIEEIQKNCGKDGHLKAVNEREKEKQHSEGSDLGNAGTQLYSKSEEDGDGVLLLSDEDLFAANSTSTSDDSEASNSLKQVEGVRTCDEDCEEDPSQRRCILVRCFTRFIFVLLNLRTLFAICLRKSRNKKGRQDPENRSTRKCMNQQFQPNTQSVRVNYTHINSLATVPTALHGRQQEQGARPISVPQNASNYSANMPNTQCCTNHCNTHCVRVCALAQKVKTFAFTCSMKITNALVCSISASTSAVSKLIEWISTGKCFKSRNEGLNGRQIELEQHAIVGQPHQRMNENEYLSEIQNPDVGCLPKFLRRMRLYSLSSIPRIASEQPWTQSMQRSSQPPSSSLSTANNGDGCALIVCMTARLRAMYGAFEQKVQCISDFVSTLAVSRVLHNENQHRLSNRSRSAAFLILFLIMLSSIAALLFPFWVVRQNLRCSHFALNQNLDNSCLSLPCGAVVNPSETKQKDLTISLKFKGKPGTCPASGNNDAIEASASYLSSQKEYSEKEEFNQNKLPQLKDQLNRENCLFQMQKYPNSAYPFAEKMLFRIIAFLMALSIGPIFLLSLLRAFLLHLLFYEVCTSMRTSAFEVVLSHLHTFILSDNTIESLPANLGLNTAVGQRESFTEVASNRDIISQDNNTKSIQSYDNESQALGSHQHENSLSVTSTTKTHSVDTPNAEAVQTSDVRIMQCRLVELGRLISAALDKVDLDKLSSKEVDVSHSPFGEEKQRHPSASSEVKVSMWFPERCGICLAPIRWRPTAHEDGCYPASHVNGKEGVEGVDGGYSGAKGNCDDDDILEEYGSEIPLSLLSPCYSQYHESEANTHDSKQMPSMISCVNDKLKRALFAAHLDNETPMRPHCASGRHIFHHTCLSSWLERKSVCPLDNTPVSPQPQHVPISLLLNARRESWERRQRIVKRVNVHQNQTVGE